MATETPYDQVTYPSGIFLQTCPSRMAVLARLHGLDPPDVETAQVLEIGGGDGLNLIALAAAFPRARFVSFDLAARTVAAGRELATAAGLVNIEIMVGDILEMARQIVPGRFDYVIAHGVYAWVPEPVRDATLALNAHTLAPAGVAIVSYNALPGGHVRMVMRDMLLHALDGVSGIANRISAARAFLDAYHLPRESDDVVVSAMRKQAEAMLTRPDAVLFHDELGDVFAPQSLTMINAAAAAAGLRYLNDAGTNRTVDGFLPDDDLSPRDPEVAVVRHAQAGDYEQMRFFRQNLFVHHNQKPRRVPVLAALDTLYVAGHFEPTDEEGGLQRGEARFVLRDPALTAALLRLSDHWPRYVRFSDVFAGEEARKGVLELWHKGLIFLSPTAERFALEPGERPSTSPLVRALIATGSERLCTLSHEVILVGDPVARELLTALDGAHDRQQLAQIWSGLAHNPELTLDAALGALAAKRLLRSG